MNTNAMTREQVREMGLKALTQRLGTVGMIRFLQQFDPGQGDYTRERKKLHRGLTAEGAYRAITSKRKK